VQGESRYAEVKAARDTIDCDELLDSAEYVDVHQCRNEQDENQ
jgi:hypothetical protein